MRLMKPIVLTVVAAFAVGEAAAQSPFPSRRMGGGGQDMQIAEGEIAVQSQRSISLSLDRSEDAPARQDDAMRMIYRMVDRDCGLMLETVAKTCELAGLGVNSSYSERPEGVGRPSTLSVSVTFVMKVRLKAAEPAPR